MRRHGSYSAVERATVESSRSGAGPRSAWMEAAAVSQRSRRGLPGYHQRRLPGRSRGLRAFLTAGLASILAGGCKTLPTAGEGGGASDGLGYEERRSRLLETPDWRMDGRIAVNTGAEAFQGRFRWRQAEGEVELSISNPLGMSVLQVSGPHERLTVRAGGETWELADPEPELSALLGWWLPVRSLDAWLLGHADPDFGADRQFDPSRTELRTLEQRLWRLTYQSYRLHEGLLLPRRIDLAHGALELRVIVDSWRPSS